MSINRTVLPFVLFALSSILSSNVYSSFDKDFFFELVKVSNEVALEELATLPQPHRIEYALAIANYEISKGKYDLVDFWIDYVLDNFPSDHIARSKSWFLKATVSSHEGDVDGYYKYIDNAVEESIKGEDYQLTKYYLHSKASSLHSAGRLAEARKVLNRLLEVFQAEPDDTERIMVLQELSQVSYKMGDIESSKKSAFAANALNKSIQNLKAQGMIDKVLGNIARSEGESEIALQHLKRAIKIFSQLEEFHELGNCLYNKALVEGSSGTYDQAILTLNEALYIFTKQGSLGGVGMCYMTLGSYKMNLQEFDHSKLFLDLAKYFNDRSGSQFRLAQTYMYIGHWHHSNRNIDDALLNYSESKRIYEELGLDSYVNKLSQLTKACH